ncbi:DUF3592 domain-containing protein [Pigmentiphaga aceris]|uniref:DUF3592 domain-containing protein n=1 Tax=Pigmentiphaga aceris TaxID=1940612 RepID=A0A5C0AZA3_9BURK|nr:DUF3592 domain-containing protein [Pigmentiphaga aceris]QEI07515.1 DUF3592 domain-containing protein [Pigmentiphaga aceris]
MRRVVRWLVTMLAIAGPVVFLCLMLSPRLMETMSIATDNLVPVEAQLTSCTPHRNGQRAQSEIICRFTFTYEGTQRSAESSAWSRDDPFLTSDGLVQALAQQSAQTTRTAYLRPRAPEAAALSDPRWVTTPPLWLLLLGLFGASMAVIVRADPSGLPHRRADLAPDPATGHLVSINHHRRDRIRRRLVIQAVAALLAGGICVFGLSNQPANTVAMLGMRALQPVPAQLVDCGHRYHRTGRSGYDSLECGFVYTVAGNSHRGVAESLRFGLIPTNARMDAEVAKLKAQPAVTAYVDPRYPNYAWAFLNENMFVLFSWGLFELQLLLVVLVMGGVIIAAAVRWQRAD